MQSGIRRQCARGLTRLHARTRRSELVAGSLCRTNLHIRLGLVRACQPVSNGKLPEMSLGIMISKRRFRLLAAAICRAYSIQLDQICPRGDLGLVQMAQLEHGLGR